MPRDTKTKAYITVAVNKDSDLMRQLLEDEKRKGIPKSHLIVSYADEYVRLFIQGQAAPISPQNTLPMAKVSAFNQQNDAIITSEISDDDLAEFYGD
jgi:hypothetical protein